MDITLKMKNSNHILHNQSYYIPIFNTCNRKMLTKIIQFFTRSELLFREKQQDYTIYKKNVEELTDKLEYTNQQNEVLQSYISRLQNFKQPTQELPKLQIDIQQKLISDIEFLYIERDELKTELEALKKIAIQKDLEIKTQKQMHQKIQAENEELQPMFDTLLDTKSQLQKEISELEKEL